MYKSLGNYQENEATFFKPQVEWAEASASTVNPDWRDLFVDSGASIQMMTKTDLFPEELETVEVSRLPTTVIMANLSIDTTEEAVVHVKDLDMFFTVQLLETHTSGPIKQRILFRMVKLYRENEIISSQ